MVIALLLSLLLAQATAPPKTAPAPQPQPTTPPKTQTAPPKTTPPPRATPAQPRTPAARQPAPSPVAGIAITVTDGKGSPFADVDVELTGSVSRNEKTNSAGQASIPGLRAGTYRLRFTGETVTAFEREVTLKPGEIMKLPVTLSAAPPPKVITPPPAPTPPPPAVGPVGQPQLGSVSALADKERNAKERREVLLSCSGNTRNILLVLTDELPQRIYDGAESTFYVISGQGGAIVGKYQSMITAGSFISVPRGTPFTIGRQGNRPLAMLWTLSGEPCESAK